ncbi:hypothetical protein [Streptomyces europaeiscabiei]
MALINRGCQRVIRTGAEHLDIALLDRVKNDAAAGKGQCELRLAFEKGKLRSQPREKAA